MALIADGLAAVIKEKMAAITVADAENPGDQNAGIDAMAAAITEYIVANLEITVPSGRVVIAVTGGSGALALGAKNAAPISCEVG